MIKQLVALLAVVLLVSPAMAGIETQVSPDGHQIKIYVDDVDFEAWIESIPEGTRETGCLNSTSSYGIDWDWTVEGYREGAGFNITGGFIDGTICDAPNWAVTRGTITKTSLQLNADYIGGGSCAAELDMSGSRELGTPRIWIGEYGWPAHAFPHETEFLGLYPCP